MKTQLPKGSHAAKRGWLLIRKGHWKKRWVVMESNGYLKWYNMKGAPKGLLKLKNSSYSCAHRAHSHHKFCFEISHPGWFGKTKFRASSQDEFTSWLRLIQRAIADVDSMDQGNLSPCATHKLRDFSSSDEEEDVSGKKTHHKRVSSGDAQNVSQVLGVTHHTHIEYDPVTGTLSGLPDEWSGLASVEQRAHKAAAISLEDNARNSLKGSQIFSDVMNSQAALKFEEAACERYFARDLNEAELDYKMAAAIHFARCNYREAARTMSICEGMWKEEARKKKKNASKDMETAVKQCMDLAKEYEELANALGPLDFHHTFKIDLKKKIKRRRSSLQQLGGVATTAMMAEGYSTLAFLAIVSSSRRPKDTNVPNLTRRRRDARFDTTTGAKSGSSVVHYFSDFIDKIPVLRLGRVASLRSRGEVESKAFAGSLEGLIPPASEKAMHKLARAIDELNKAMSGSKEKKEEKSLENLLRLVRKAREQVSALNCFVWPISMRSGILWYGLGRIKLRLESLEPFLEVLLSIAELNSENEKMWWQLLSRSCPSVRACITKRVEMLEKLMSTTQKAQSEIVNILKYVALEYQVRMGDTMQELQSVAQLKRLETGKLECVAFADSLQKCNTLLNDVLQTADFNLGLLQDALLEDCNPDAVIAAVEGAQHKQEEEGDEFSLRRQKSRKAMVKSYALESHGIKGVHIPAVSLKRFYDHWKRYCYFPMTGSRTKSIDSYSPLHTELYRGASFQEYLLLYPYKSEAELYLLMMTSPTRSASLQEARLLDGVSRNLVEYWHTPQDRESFRVNFHRIHDNSRHSSYLTLDIERADSGTPEAATSPKVTRIRADAEEATVAPRHGGAILKWCADGSERLEAHRHRQNEIVGTGQMTTFASGKGVAMVVVRESDMFIHSHVKDRFHHSSIFAGEPVHFAGEIKVSQGRIEWISNKSGHYQPGLAETYAVLEFLHDRGCNLNSFAIDIVERPEFVKILSHKISADVMTVVEKRSAHTSPVKYIRISPAACFVNALRDSFQGVESPKVSSSSSPSRVVGRKGSPLAEAMRQRGRSVEWAAQRSMNRRRSTSCRSLRNQLSPSSPDRNMIAAGSLKRSKSDGLRLLSSSLSPLSSFGFDVIKEESSSDKDGGADEEKSSSRDEIIDASML